MGRVVRRLREMTLRSKLVTAFAAWTILVLALTAGYVVLRFGALTAGLSPARLIQSQEALSALWWLAVALAAATVIFAVVVTRAILHPITALARAVRAVKPGAAHVPLPPVVTRDRDLWELTQAFDQMAYALAERDASLQHALRERERQLNELAMIARFVEGCAQFQDSS
jgi:methyl-accepting chemotaxis protein